MKLFGALAVLALAAATLALPTSSAQAFDGVELSFGTDVVQVPYGGSVSVEGTLTVGCLAALQDTDQTAEIGVENAPAWLTIAVDAVDIAPGLGCITGGSGTITASVPVTLTVSKDAPGVVVQTVNLLANVNDVASAPAPVQFAIAYHAEYDVVPDVQFPLKVTGSSVSFNLTVTQKSNARSMVMMEEKSETAGSLSGLASTVYENDARTKVFPITYKAPAGAWTNATVSFKTYSHYLLPEGAGNYSAGKEIKWTFENGGAATAPTEKVADKKDSPAPVAPMVALGLLALAAFARRR